MPQYETLPNPAMHPKKEYYFLTVEFRSRFNYDHVTLTNLIIDYPVWQFFKVTNKEFIRTITFYKEITMLEYIEFERTNLNG